MCIYILLCQHDVYVIHQVTTASTTTTTSEDTPSTAAADGDSAPKPKKAKTVKKKKKAKGPTDEQLFGNTDDVFGGVPEGKPKATKTKKKKKSSGEAVREGEGGAATGEHYVCVCVVVWVCGCIVWVCGCVGVRTSEILCCEIGSFLASVYHL